MDKAKTNEQKASVLNRTNSREIPLLNRQLKQYYNSLNRLERLNFRESVIKKAMLENQSVFYNWLSGQMRIRNIYATIINVCAGKEILTIK